MKAAAFAPTLLTALAVACATVVTAAEDPPRPNIVVVLCDALGWGDLRNYGHPTIETPRLMDMAAEGVRFSSFDTFHIWPGVDSPGVDSPGVNSPDRKAP